MELIAHREGDIPSIDDIYQEAFPEDERFPLDFLLDNIGEIGKLDVLKEGKEVMGFVYLLVKDDLVHIFFLAIASDHRGKGLGGIILEEIKKKYAGKRLFLALEPLDENASNYKQRQRRDQFYARHSFEHRDIHIKERDLYYDVMAIGEVSAQEYDDMVLDWCGPEAKEYYHMAAI